MSSSFSKNNNIKKEKKDEEDSYIDVSWAEEVLVQDSPNTIVKNENKIMDNNMKKTEEGNFMSHSQCDKIVENKNTIMTTTTIPKKVIPFDYDNFCSNMPDSMRPYFEKSCKHIKKSTPKVKSEQESPPAQYLTVPKQVYGGPGIRRRRRSNQSPRGRRSESETSDIETNMKSRDANGNELSGDESDLEIKEPRELQRKKIYPSSVIKIQLERKENNCIVM